MDSATWQRKFKAAKNYSIIWEKFLVASRETIVNDNEKELDALYVQLKKEARIYRSLRLKELNDIADQNSTNL